jgi:hypothetical protein
VQRIDYDTGGVERIGCAKGAGCLVWSSGFVLVPLAYLLVGWIAPPGKSKDRENLRELFAMMRLPELGFLADMTIAQVITVFILLFVVLTAGIVVGQSRWVRSLRQLPCHRCGATAGTVSGHNPLILTCHACAIEWVVRYSTGSSDQHHVDHGIHHHHHM